MAADGSIIIDTTVDGSGLKTGLASLGKVAVAGVAAAATAVVALGTAAVKVGSDFEVSAAKVSTMFGGVAVDTQGLQEQMLALSSKTGLAATEIGESLYQALSAGVPVTEDMTGAMEFLEQATSLAKGGFTTTAGAVDVMTTALNAYGMGVDQAATVSDILIMTQNKGKTTVDELASSLGRVLPAAAAFNVGLTDVGAAMATMTASGIQTAESTTYLKSIINELGKDGSKVADILKEKTGQSFAQMMASGASLGDVMGVLQDSVNGDATAFANLWSSQEAGIGALSISQAGVEAYNETLNAMENSSGAAADASAKMSDTLQNNVAQMTESAKNLGIAVYQDMQEPLKEAAKWATSSLQDLAAAFNEGGLDGLVSAIGDVLAQTVTKITEYVPQILSAGTSLITSLLSGIKANLPTIAPALVETLNGLVISIIDILPLLLDTGIQLVSALISGIGQQLPSLIPMIVQGIIDLAYAVIDNVPLMIEAAITLVMGLADGIISAIPVLVAALPEIISSILNALWESEALLIQAGIDLLTSLVSALPEIITGIVEAIPQIIDGIVTAFVKNIPIIIQAGFDLLVSLVQALPQIITSLFTIGPQIVGAIVAALLDNIDEIVQCGVDLFAALIENLPAIILGIVQAIPEIINGIVQGFESSFGKIAESGKNLLSALFAKKDRDAEMNDFANDLGVSTEEAMQRMTDAAGKTSLVDKIKPKLDETTTAISEWGSEVIESARTTFDETVSSVSEWGTNLTASVSEAFPQFIESAKEWLVKLPEEMAFQLGAGIGHLISFGVALFTWVTTAIPAAINAAVEWFAALPARIGEWLSTTSTNISAWGTELFNKAVETGTNFIAGIIQFVQTLPEQTNIWLTSTLENVASWATELLAKAVQAASSFLNNIVTYFKQLPGKIAEQLTQAWSNVVSWSQDLISTATTKIPEFAREVLDAISSLPGDFLDIGANIVFGLWNGISSGWDWLTSQVKNLAKSLIKGVKSTLGINSPSKEFAYLGEMSSLGLAVGFDENADTVLKSVNDLTKKISGKGIDLGTIGADLRRTTAGAQSSANLASVSDAISRAAVLSGSNDNSESYSYGDINIKVEVKEISNDYDVDDLAKDLGKKFLKHARLKGVLQGV